MKFRIVKLEERIAPSGWRSFGGGSGRGGSGHGRGGSGHGRGGSNHGQGGSNRGCPRSCPPPPPRCS